MQDEKNVSLNLDDKFIGVEFIGVEHRHEIVNLFNFFVSTMYISHFHEVMK